MRMLEAAKRQPTLASVWQTMADGTIGDELLEWPPDLFALTEVILQRSEALPLRPIPASRIEMAAGPRPQLVCRCRRRRPGVERLGRGQNRGTS